MRVTTLHPQLQVQLSYRHHHRHGAVARGCRSRGVTSHDTEPHQNAIISFLHTHGNTQFATNKSGHHPRGQQPHHSTLTCSKPPTTSVTAVDVGDSWFFFDVELRVVAFLRSWLI